MSRLAGDPGAIRSRAALVATLLGDRVTPWQARFLNRLTKFQGPDLLSMEDRETLYNLAGKASRRSERAGYRAANLVERLWCLRHDLAEEDEKFVDGLKIEGEACAPTENQWRKLFVLARQVGEVDHFVA
jgi:hypothetical protein